MTLKMAALLFLIAAAANAQPPAMPQALIDSRFASVDYEPNRVYQLSVAPGYELTVALAPDEQVQSIALGDSSAWQVSADHAGNHLFVKLVQGGSPTNMTVITNVRLYAFDLVPANGRSSASGYSVNFRYPRAGAGPASEPRAIVGQYSVSGARTLRPSRISDDGQHTFIEWPRSVDLPAVYAVDARGQETLVNGMMRGDRLVIDDVARRLVFRIDQQVAYAVRLRNWSNR